MLSEIKFTAAFNKEIDMIPSFGSFGFFNRHGDEMRFDFMNSEIFLTGEDCTTVQVRMYELDTSTFPESAAYTAGDFVNGDNLTSVSEIFCHTGESDICPSLIGVQDVCLTFANGEVIRIPQNIIDDYFEFEKALVDVYESYKSGLANKKIA